MIRFSCPKCGTQYDIEDESAGVHAVCEVCNTKMTIPLAGGTECVVAGLAGGQVDYEVLQKSNEVSSPEKTEISFDESVNSVIQSRPSTVAPVASCKTSPRQRRLLADLKSLTEHFSAFPLIRVKSSSGNPPERYVIVYNVKGIERIDGERIVYRNYHEVEIKLPGTYPRTPPLCRMLTPVFHPNIEPAVICIGDHWTAAERLCDLVVRIGEMIAYQAHNVKSPLDGEAAMWTDLHLDMLPIDSSDLTPPDL